MNSKISGPNFIVTLLITYSCYKVTMMTCDYFEFFKKKETIATIEAREIINSVNKTKFVFAGPAKWEKLSKYDYDSCIKDNGKINWAVVEFFLVQLNGASFTKPDRMKRMTFADEDAFFYNLTEGIIPRHLRSKFLTFKEYEPVYLSWKNIIRNESNEPSMKYNTVCSKILDEVRKPTSEEFEEYAKLEPTLLIPTPR